MTSCKYVIDGQSFLVEIIERSRTRATLVVNGTRYEVERALADQAENLAPPVVGALPAARAARPATGDVRAPMAGRVVHLHCHAGDHVAAGAPLLVLDAMKMENIIQAPHAGRVDEIALNVGETVLQGGLLLRLV